jgi:hypothetical protein
MVKAIVKRQRVYIAAVQMDVERAIHLPIGIKLNNDVLLHVELTSNVRRFVFPT